MSTTSKISLDYLKLPTNQSLVQSKPPRRTCSFIEKSNQIDERLASNLSLRSAGNGILKQTNSPRSSHLSVHYAPDNTEFIPTIESSPVIEHHLRNTFKIPTHYGLHTSTWLHRFSHRRYETDSLIVHLHYLRLRQA
jgi:hypothetical protein